MKELNLQMKTSTQVYYNEYLSTWMTRIWYIDRVKGVDVQKMKEVETSKEYIPKPRVSLVYSHEAEELSFNEALLRLKFDSHLGV